MSPFTSWTDGQPWWVTLLLLPALVLAALTAKLIHYVVTAILAVAGLGLAAALWRWRRRR